MKGDTKPHTDVEGYCGPPTELETRRKEARTQALREVLEVIEELAFSWRDWGYYGPDFYDKLKSKLEAMITEET